MGSMTLLISSPARAPRRPTRRSMPACWAESRPFSERRALCSRRLSDRACLKGILFVLRSGIRHSALACLRTPPLPFRKRLRDPIPIAPPPSRRFSPIHFWITGAASTVFCRLRPRVAAPLSQKCSALCRVWHNRISMGLRNSHEKSMRLAMTCGYR
jgi:hypothetical protein